MKNVIILLSVFIVSLTACVSNDTVIEDFQKQNEQDWKVYNAKIEEIGGILESKEYPLLITYIGSGNPDSANGVNVRALFRNISGKELKYVRFYVTPYNRVNDIVKCEIRGTDQQILKHTGPDLSGIHNEIVSDYGNVWYHPQLDHIELNRIEIIYMDDSTEDFTEEESKQMIQPVTLGNASSYEYKTY